MYDTVTDRWSLVRASPRNILEEIQILEDSQAIQINDDQIYIFGGKNSNKYFCIYLGSIQTLALFWLFPKSGRREKERPKLAGSSGT
jgi:hypothetical protein